MSKKNMSEEDIKKSIDDMLDQEIESYLNSEIENVEKSVDDEEEVEKSGQGGDKNSEKMDGIKGDDAAKKERPTEATGGKDVLKAKKNDKNMKKMEIEIEEDDEEEEEDKEDKKKDSKEMEKKMKTKKSFQVSEEDFELLQKAKQETLQKAKQDREEAFTKSVYEIVDEKISSELDGLKNQLEDIKKSLSKPNQRKSIDNLEAVNKSFHANEEKENKKLSKSEILDIAEELAKSNQISINSVIEYESCNSISNRQDAVTLKKAIDKKIDN